MKLNAIFIVMHILLLALFIISITACKYYLLWKNRQKSVKTISLKGIKRIQNMYHISILEKHLHDGKSRNVNC